MIKNERGAIPFANWRACQRDSFCFKASIRTSSLASFSFAFVKNLLPFDISKTTLKIYCRKRDGVMLRQRTQLV